VDEQGNLVSILNLGCFKTIGVSVCHIFVGSSNGTLPLQTKCCVLYDLGEFIKELDQCARCYKD
jgi:hypothetical protein